MTSLPDHRRCAAGTVSPYRSTTGQAVSFAYDVRTGALVIAEDDWFAQPLRSSAVPSRVIVRQRLERRRPLSR